MTHLKIVHWRDLSLTARRIFLDNLIPSLQDIDPWFFSMINTPVLLSKAEAFADLLLSAECSDLGFPHLLLFASEDNVAAFLSLVPVPLVPISQSLYVKSVAKFSESHEVISFVVSQSVRKQPIPRITHVGSRYLSKLVVYPGFRGQGIARNFLSKAISSGSRSDVLLHVHRDNLPAFHLYKSLGFFLTTPDLLDSYDYLAMQRSF